MIFHCPKCGERCTRLYFDFRDKIIACDVCRQRITEFELEDEHEPVRIERRIPEDA